MVNLGGALHGLDGCRAYLAITFLVMARAKDTEDTKGHKRMHILKTLWVGFHKSVDHNFGIF